MGFYNGTIINDQLSRRTSIFGLRLWMVLGISVGSAIVLLLFLFSLWFTSCRSSGDEEDRRSSSKNKTIPLSNHHSRDSSCRHSPPSSKLVIPKVCKEIQEIRIDHTQKPVSENKPLLQVLALPAPDSGPQQTSSEADDVGARNGIHVDIGKENRITFPELPPTTSSHASGESRSTADPAATPSTPEVSHLGWGHWYTLRDLEVATNFFADENVIGEGGYGIVYRGVLQDNTSVAVKNLLNNRHDISSSPPSLSKNADC